MGKPKKAVKFKKRRKINIGTIIFFFIALYLTGFAIYYSGKERISIYEVTEENLARDMEVTGVIVRDETLFCTPEAGYINYYLRAGSRVRKNAAVYSIDANRAVYDMIGGTGDITLTEKDIAEVKRIVSSFQAGYDGTNFADVYELKETLVLKTGEISDNNLLDRMQDMIDTAGISNGFRFVQAEKSGLISYTSDSLDGLTVEGVNASTFLTENFTSASLRSTKQYMAGEPAYKLVCSDTWQIVCPVTPDQYVALKERTSLRFMAQDGLLFSAPVEFTPRGSDYYMVVTMNRYEANYLEERFLTLDILVSEDKGLKIPKTAVTVKDFYLIPPQYFTAGGDSNDTGLYSVSYSAKTGEPEYVFLPAEIYYQDGEYAYVAKDEFPAATTIYCPETKETMPLALTSQLEGVYQVNRGYAVFRRIERVEENGDYVIVAKGTSRGVSAYDHIALNAEHVVDESIIY